MIKPVANLFVSGSINPHFKNYHLCIEIGASVFKYAIYNIVDNKYVGYKEYCKDASLEIANFVSQILENDQLLSLEFEKVTMVYQSFRTMLIPQTLFNSGNINEFMKFHHDIDENDTLKWNKINEAEAFNVFVMSKNIENILKSKYNNIVFCHHTWSLINSTLLGCTPVDPVINLNLNFGPDFFNVLILRNHKIILFNTFFYKKYTDVVYFLANILNLYSLTPEKLSLTVTGDIASASELSTEIKKILPTLTFAPLCNKYNYTSTFSDIESHQYSNLLNSLSCE